MPKLVSDEQATGKVKDVFEEIRGQFGRVPNFFRAQAAVDPDWLELNWSRWKVIMGRQRSLDSKTKELIAMAVSIAHDCAYCAAAHETTSRAMGAAPEEVGEAKQIVELFASFSRIADSLRIPLEPEFDPEHPRQHRHHRRSTR